MPMEPLTAFSVVADQEGDSWRLTWRTPTQGGHLFVSSIDDVEQVTREVADVISAAIGAPTSSFDVLLLIDKRHDLVRRSAA